VIKAFTSGRRQVGRRAFLGDRERWFSSRKRAWWRARTLGSAWRSTPRPGGGAARMSARAWAPPSR